MLFIDRINKALTTATEQNHVTHFHTTKGVTVAAIRPTDNGLYNITLNGEGEQRELDRKQAHRIIFNYVLFQFPLS